MVATHKNHNHKLTGNWIHGPCTEQEYFGKLEKEAEKLLVGLAK